ncbi:MrcB family domain-containing protein [Paenibacillus koleovorans]|uniref:MrcB family domain-containing protein n=1 Tax=Paenibacillus koleovorans TaxID=121608 RepID=UPI000FD78F46|nr:DUF3578 domain-containing protein [Paenibacillus koleovorans]
MTIPQQLNDIFKHKQRSYKMVLILALTEEGLENSTSLNLIADRFRQHFIDRENKGLPVDNPPTYMGDSWKSLTEGQLRTVIQNPVNAMQTIVEMNPTNNSISFKPEIAELLTPELIAELRQYALQELDSYYTSEATPHQDSKEFSIRGYFQQVMDSYILAKRESIKQHPMDQHVRKTIPHELEKLDFIQAPLTVEGSAGKGNWATVPWIAIMDSRITSTTQKGQYLVYLFSEDMGALYLSFAQGVTEPMQQHGKKKAYLFFEQIVIQIRSLLPLEGTRQDRDIFLTTSPLGEAYQAGTVAYYKYESGNLPSDEQLRADLENMVENYRLFVERRGALTAETPPPQKPTFKVTMAYLHYIQGVMYHLSNHPRIPIPIQDLLDPANRSTIFKSGESIKNPEDRLRVFCKVLQDFSLITLASDQITLSPQGETYCNHFQENHWTFDPEQIRILRTIVADEDVNNELVQVIRLAIDLTKELNTFNSAEFQNRFIEAMGTTDWEEITKESRSRFMLNWLQELEVVQKSTEGLYRYREEEPTMPLDDHLPVQELVRRIEAYILGRGFTYPPHLLENFYLSLKTKPFVILAGISGTGKTKLVQLFAEAVGATEKNGQFQLIPVRPDWSDPSDMIGYTDLSHQFRPGPLTSVLLEASHPDNRTKSYFICLDEMNLARVEHYFSDLLSLLETQRWEKGSIVTDAVVKQDQLKAMGRSDLPLNGDLHIPDNVYLIGTVNMDETTHPFSKKVLDRANTLEFNYINLNRFPESTGEGPRKAIAVSNAFLRSEYLHLQDAYGAHAELIREVTVRLVQVNDILEEVHAHIGFRVRDAVSFYMIYNATYGLMSQDEAFDCQLLQKILPRLQGSSQSVKQVLVELYLLSVNRPRQNMAALVEDASDLYKPWRRGAEPPQTKYPQSARKLAYMLRRFEEDGFTSFWLS